MGSTEDKKTYSAQVEPRKMASDREVLSSDPFNRGWDFCSLHGTSAWNNSDPKNALSDGSAESEIKDGRFQ